MSRSPVPSTAVFSDGRSLAQHFRTTGGIPPDVDHVRAQLATIGQGLRTGPSTIPRAGNGLFATRAFRPREIITWYDGPVARHQDYRTLAPRLRSHAMTLFSQKYTILGSHPLAHLGREGMGGGALANAPVSGQIEANAEFMALDDAAARQMSPFDGRLPYHRIIVLVAVAPIASGQEIIASYGSDYWEHEAAVGHAPSKEPVLLPATEADYLRLLAEDEEARQEKRQNQRRIQPQPLIILKGSSTPALVRHDRVAPPAGYHIMAHDTSDTGLIVCVPSMASSLPQPPHYLVLVTPTSRLRGEKEEKYLTAAIEGLLLGKGRD